MIVTIEGTGHQLKLASVGDQTHISPYLNFDAEDPRDVVGLSHLITMVKAGQLTLDDRIVKSAVVVVPAGQAEQQQTTQPPPPGNQPVSVSMDQFQSLQQQVAQLTQVVQQMSGQAPQDPGVAAADAGGALPSLAPAAPAPAAAPAKTATLLD
jgi:hypothetical protein